MSSLDDSVLKSFCIVDVPEPVLTCSGIFGTLKGQFCNRENMVDHSCLMHGENVKGYICSHLLIDCITHD